GVVDLQRGRQRAQPPGDHTDLQADDGRGEEGHRELVAVGVGRGGDVRVQVHAEQGGAEVGGRGQAVVGAGGGVVVGRAGAVEGLDVGHVRAVDAGLGADVLVVDPRVPVGLAVEHAQDVAGLVEHGRVQVGAARGAAGAEQVGRVQHDVAGPGGAGPLE